MASLSGQQGGGSKDNPPGKSSSAENTGQVRARYLGGDGSEGQGKGVEGSGSDTSTETTRTSNPLSGLGSSDEGGGAGGTTAGEFAGEGPSEQTGGQRSLAEGASHG